MNLRISRKPGQPERGLLSFGEQRLACALGRSGIRALKREGDGATPAGCWLLRRVLYRPDRVTRPRTRLPVKAITPAMGWCDTPGDRNYNRAVRLPYPAGCEALWRDDRIYDILVILSHNERPRVRGHGSAVFLHLARPGYTPTEGCVALSEAALRRVLAASGPDTRLCIPG
ncbi:MAG: L,D-transpeptidase [Methyloligellaceae bacterium]